jgi:outer membrane protein assembly factor BamB/adenine/guanine phosphoribosyltransferase-like PRPP-binding protein
MSKPADREFIKARIESDIFVDGKKEAIVARQQSAPKNSAWLFDFRKVIFRKDVLEAIARTFWEHFNDGTPIQIGGLETAAIPLVTAISLSQPQSFEKPMSAFFVRKSRKKNGRMRMIEGTLASRDVPVVLVDDILNSGKTFIRQVEVLEELGHTVAAIWSILRFRDEAFYSYFREKDIPIHSLFELNDFSDSLGVSNLHYQPPLPPEMPFTIEWKFASKKPNYFYVVPKSSPTIDDERVYVGSDSGYFWAINQKDGSTAWSYKVGFHAKGKSIFSSPAISHNTVFFGAYDGNVYALDTATGKRKWVFWEADYIGSSPAVAPELGLVFVGLEFGLIRRRGGIAALEVETGKKKWEFPMTSYTHSSPYYIQRKKQVVVGGNDGIVYLFDAKSGELQWKFPTGAPTEEEQMNGFSRFDIKESFAYDAKRDIIIFGNSDANVFAVNRKSGKLVWCFDHAEFGYMATPVIYQNSVIIGSLDKHVYCLDIETGEKKWSWNAGARIFASPTVINDGVYIGANTGRLTELDPATGKERAFITVPERITNTVVYNQKTKRYFLPTFANEIYCLRRDDE